MVDQEPRRHLAELLRHLVAGVITNDEFTDRLPRRSKDLAVRQVFWEGAWFLYDDLHEHRLTGKWKLTGQNRRHVARWVLFLETDLPYAWPVVPMPLRLALVPFNIVSLGLVGCLVQRYARRGGPSELWPFRRQPDFDAALKQPPYCGGPSSTCDRDPL
jgi:hypothetical protein